MAVRHGGVHAVRVVFVGIRSVVCCFGDGDRLDGGDLSSLRLHLRSDLHPAVSFWRGHREWGLVAVYWLICRHYHVRLGWFAGGI